ncbi:hypothetical protein [Vulcanococcus limneticus]|uniref:hypothetical protein n=1 Tax=Vulcanococcus limneticus TaxID=2170428 RepID=UPI00398C20A7
MDPANAVPTTKPSEPLRQPNQAAWLRARLLEFLKFRVLAAQERFFTDLQLDSGSSGGTGAVGARTPAGQLDLTRFRRWLREAGWSEALALADADLALVLEQARALYTEDRA